MKLQFTIGLLILLLATCSTQPRVKNSGIEGQVLMGPICPVVQVGQPCPEQPYQATLTVNNTGGGRVAQIQADATGHFKIPLAAGTYILHPESPNLMPHAPEQIFIVEAGKFTQVNVHYDSGIR